MLSADAESFLRQLLQVPGPSGHESRPARLWRDQAASYGAEVSRDAVGNSFAVFNAQGTPTVLFVGHLDEIGVMIQHIDENGFLSISCIGGWDPQVLVAQRIRILSQHGDVVGVVGRKPIHLIKAKDREAAARITDLWVDIGATSRSDAEQLVAVGDPGVVDVQIIDLANGRIASRAIDNRVGAFTVLEAARRYAERPGAARIVALAAAQEELGARGGGALTGGRRVSPAMAIVVDVTFATDDPNAPTKEWGEHKIGGGPVISRGGILSPVVFRLVSEAARSAKLPHTIQANPGVTGTDADSLVHVDPGIAVGLVSIPNRYMHSPNELVSLDDIDRTAELLAATARSVTTSTDFTDR